MPVKQIFVNLPVRDLQKSMDFFTKLGFSFNKQFTDQNAACLVLGENIYAMLLKEEFFKTFTKKQVYDAQKGVEAINALALESKKAVDELAAKAVKAGGKPTQTRDYGSMYQKGFEDLDGHLWEVFFMEPSYVKKE